MELPFGDLPEKVSLEKWLSLLCEGMRPSLPQIIPKSLAAIIQQSWATEPTARPTAAEILGVLDAIVITASNPGDDDRSTS